MSGDTIFQNLSYQTQDNLIIQAQRPDGTYKIIEPCHSDLWAKVQAGNFGFITAYSTQGQLDPLVLWRQSASCSRMQGILALGQVRWATIQTYKATATWAEQVVIDGSGVWYRNSQNIAFFAYLLNLSETEVDDLFRLAITIEA